MQEAAVNLYQIIGELKVENSLLRQEIALRDKRIADLEAALAAASEHANETVEA